MTVCKENVNTANARLCSCRMTWSPQVCIYLVAVVSTVGWQVLFLTTPLWLSNTPIRRPHHSILRRTFNLASS